MNPEYVEENRKHNNSILRKVWVLPICVVVIMLVSMVFFPVYQIYGNAMAPTLTDGNMIGVVKTKAVKDGELVAFYDGEHKVLVRRVIAKAGQVISLDENGVVTVDGEAIDESYLGENKVGNSDVEYPLTVPDGQLYVLGDERAISMDSRAASFGCVDESSVIGRVAVRFWPLKGIQKF